MTAAACCVLAWFCACRKDAEEACRAIGLLNESAFVQLTTRSVVAKGTSWWMLATEQGFTSTVLVISSAAL
jgi:hypothetical protein